MKQEYLHVSMENLHFLISIAWIKEILPGDRRKNGEIPVYSLAALCNLSRSGKERQYILLFSDGDVLFGISVGHVEGIVSADPEQIRTIPPEAVWEKNDYLLGAVRFEDMSPSLAYVLDFEKMNEKRMMLEPDQYL